MTIFQNQAFSNQNLVVDGNRYVACTFTDCALVYNGGDLPVFDRCDLRGMTLQLGGAALSTVRFLSGLHQGGFTKPVEAALQRIETTAARSRRQTRFYNPEYTGTNWGRLGWYGLLMFIGTLLLLMALHYGLQEFPRTQILEGETTRPISSQLSLDLMPRLPDELGETYDALSESQRAQVNGYGWVDQEAQIAHIPVERAMDLLLENGGLPAAEGE
jgi:hypothetical protein